MPRILRFHALADALTRERQTGRADEVTLRASAREGSYEVHAYRPAPQAPLARFSA